MNERKATVIVHSGNFDRIMSAFIIGNGFLSIGIPVTIFFTFWGLMALKKRGFEKAPLSRMDFLGLGRFFIKRRMKKYNVASLDVLVDSFKKLGGKIVACSMTMQLMGLAKKDLREEIIDDYGTVGTYCLLTKDANITLFI
ncbi:DsrE/DsrF/DrsH-like family protein [Candidatus Aerophobetes bacterium]|nr:DsrE/DsrF/DrsH-like family protein [Candidatus Aerophobetes bacterium]